MTKRSYDRDNIFSYKTIQIIRFGPLFSRETLRNKFKFKNIPLDCPVFRLLKKMVLSFFKTTNPVILLGAARRSRRVPCYRFVKFWILQLQASMPSVQNDKKKL